MACEYTVFLAVCALAINGRNLYGLLMKSVKSSLVLRIPYQLSSKLRLWWKQHEGAAIDGVCASGKDGHLGISWCDAISVCQGEVNLCTLGATNPVCLHSTNTLWPALKLVKVIKELLSVISDAQVPLRELAFLWNRATAPALTVNYLLICKNSFVVRTPVNRACCAIYQTLLKHLEEDPLAPLVVLRVTCVKHAVFVISKAHAEHGLYSLVNIFMSPHRRLSIVLNSSVFCRKTKSVKAHWMQNIKTAHTGLTSHSITNGVVTSVTHVKIARRIREHL